GPLPAGSPMLLSGLEPGDRFLAADGEPLYSLEQFSDIINQQRAFLTVQRGSRLFAKRVTRVPLSALKIKGEEQAEILDRQYAAQIKTKPLYTLPYTISNNLVVEAPLMLVDE